MTINTSGNDIIMSTLPLSRGRREDAQLSLVDRVQLTQPIWHRTTTNRAAAIHLLLNKPPGTFIVRDVVERKAACLMLSIVISSHPKTRVSHLPIYRSSPQEGSRLHLADWQRDFQDLTSLVAFYCSTKAESDMHLPRLFLPKEILEAKTRQHLLSLAHLGHYFWVPSLFGRNYALPKEVNDFVSDKNTLDDEKGICYDSTKNFSHALQSSPCSSPSSESISGASPLMLADREYETDSQPRLIDQQNRFHSVDVSGSCCDLLPISRGFGGTSSDSGSGYVSSSESGSDVVNGMIYYRSQLQDKLSDYEDIWPSHSSSESYTLPYTFSGSNTPPQAFSSPARLPTPFAVDNFLSSSDDVLFSSQHLNLTSSGCSYVAETRMPMPDRPVAAAADIHCRKSSHSSRKVSGTDQMKYQLNRGTGAGKQLPLLGIAPQSEFQKEGNRIASSKSEMQNCKLVKRNPHHQQQQSCDCSMNKMESHRLETMGVFHFDFQQTSRLASHVARVTRCSPLQYTSPDYALPYDALPATMEGTAASCNRHLTCQSQSHMFRSRADDSRRILASRPMFPRSSLETDCNHGNCYNMPLNTDLHNAFFYRSFRNDSAAIPYKAESNEPRSQDNDFRPAVSDTQHCLGEKKSEEIVTMEVGYRLPFDATSSFEPNLVACNREMNQLLPTDTVSQAVLPLNSVFILNQAEQRGNEEEHKENKVSRKMSLRASFSAIQKKILRINRKKSRPCESFSCPDQKTESLEVPFRHIHYSDGEPRLVGTAAAAAAAATKPVMSEDDPLAACNSLRRHAFQMVNLKRRRSVYDNVCTPPYYPLLNTCDIPMCGDVPPYGDISPYGDVSPYRDVSPYGDVSLPQSRRMTATSRKSTFSTATEYCQPWETIRWSQLLASNSTHNVPQNSSVQTQGNSLNPTDGQPPFIIDSCSDVGQAVGKWHQLLEEANGTKGISWSHKTRTSDSSKCLAPLKPTDRIISSNTLRPTDDRYSMPLCSYNLQHNLTKEEDWLLPEHCYKHAQEHDVYKAKSVNYGAIPKDLTCGAVQNTVTCGAAPKDFTCGAVLNDLTCGAVSKDLTCGAIPKDLTCGAVPKSTTCGSVVEAVTYGAIPKATTCGAVPCSRFISTEAVRNISKEKMLCCSEKACDVCRNSTSGFHHNRDDDNRETLLAPMSPDVIPQSASVLELNPCSGAGCELTPAAKICNYIVNLSQRSEGFFGKIIQNFIECTRNAAEKNPKNVVRNVRQFMTGLKNYLILRGEDDLNVFIESESIKMKSSEFLNLDVILERALEDCIIQPLYEYICQLFVHEYTRDGQLQMMSDGIKFARTKTSLAKLGLQPESPCERAVAVALQFLTMMENSHSPTKKFQFLQSAIQTISLEVERCENSESRHLVYNTEGLVSSLVFILLEKGLVSAQIELDYMQGLRDLASPMTSEGIYQLELFSCAVELIKKMKNRLKATNNDYNTADILRDELLTVYVPDEKYNKIIDVRIPFQPNTVTRDIRDMMAYKMRMTNPQDYGLFLMTERTEDQLLDFQKISKLLLVDRVKTSTSNSHSPGRLIYKRINAKLIWPKNLYMNSVTTP